MTRRNRFPPLKRGPDGRILCRGCGGTVPPKRRTWCSRECKEAHDPFWVKIAVAKRARCLCEKCTQPVQAPWEAWVAIYGGDGTLYVETRRRLPRGEFHHIIPFSEGGAGTADNIQLLCHKCHKEVTAAWRKQKSLIP